MEKMYNQIQIYKRKQAQYKEYYNMDSFRRKSSNHTKSKCSPFIAKETPNTP